LMPFLNFAICCSWFAITIWIHELELFAVR
jgi:hypothetical protein